MAAMPNIKLPTVQLPGPGADAQKSLWRRLGWFFAIWATSALAVAVFAYGLRAIFRL